MVLLSLSIGALRRLLLNGETFDRAHGLGYNVKKSKKKDFLHNGTPVQQSKGHPECTDRESNPGAVDTTARSQINSGPAGDILTTIFI
ncbi:hypothetical protein EVAR_30965_1 [Eumeta japonica]|uniref:Uncharacterized protein n=1 Tax=Eumeta variegata TaxID=151549 RepID=A0A4C1W7D5_EUMVA|nr:hypothetical protein EVAR_30965_1 [Eumeta japonica]